MKSYNQDIELCGIPEHLVQQHQSRIRRWLEESRCHFFKIIDTCRRDNDGIVDFDFISNLTPFNGTQASGISAFVPAAGASSRYFQSLENLSSAIFGKDWEGARITAQKLTAHNQFQSWPLPAWKKDFISRISQGFIPGSEEISNYQRQINLPKALQLSSSGERSFLLEKVLEHQHIPEINHQVYVAPPRYTEDFSNELSRLGDVKPWEVLAQSADLSTVRFDLNAEPIRQTDGTASIVPAGHGALARLFRLAASKSGNDVLFIRNIDNFTGIGQSTITSTSAFLRGSQNLRSWILALRNALAHQELTTAENLAQKFAEEFKLDLSNLQDETRELVGQFALNGVQALSLSLIQLKLFHTPTKFFRKLIEQKGARDAIMQLYLRPLNILGQVRNTERDIGGTPCFVDVAGSQVKICLEVPHASLDDKQNFLANPERATHFNPVFAYTEVPAKVDYYDDHANDFWIIAEKKFESKRVFYHETVLYELIGNSLASNCLFVEIPRGLFKPHKSLSDHPGI